MKNKRTYMLAVASVWILMTAMMIATLSLSARGTEYDSNTDYMALMEAAAVTGDAEAGQAAEAARNAKTSDMGITTSEIAWEDLYLLSKIIYAEAGSDWLSDEHQLMVGSVLLNRIASPEFPDTIEACIYQKGQYYSRSSAYFANLRPSERAVRNAKYLLENGTIAPLSVVFQANFPQGNSAYLIIGDKYLGNTYFCYSSNISLYSEVSS